MTLETAAQKNIQKLQRAIVDGLEDVKAQDIVVFNTAELSPLFERVIIASGTSNRQTKALAASVSEAVREAGYDKPRTEGEENGEWIIVDCGPAVVHVMQPVIRQYYRLEEIWGAKPVRLKLGAERARAAAARKAPRSSEDKLVAVAAPKTPRRRATTAIASDETPATRAPRPRRAATATGESAGTARTRRRSTAGEEGGASPSRPPRRATALPKLVVNAPRPAAKSGAKAPSKTAPKAAAKSARATKPGA